MIKAVVTVSMLILGLSSLALVTGYVKYRSDMNACIDSGGVVIKTAAGLKCVPRGEIKVI